MYRLRLKPQCMIPEGFGTDGSRLYYDSQAFVLRYRDTPVAEMRRYLHSVFHCIFLHPFAPAMASIDVWELACDITVEAGILTQLGEFALPGDAERLHAIQNIQKHVPLLTAHEVANYLRQHPEDQNLYRKMFTFDHHLWIHGVARSDLGDGDEENTQEDAPLNKAIGCDENNRNRDDHENSNFDEDNSDRDDSLDENSSGMPNDADAEPTDDTDTEKAEQPDTDNDGCEVSCNPGLSASSLTTAQMSKCAEAWKDAAQRISMDMKAFSNRGTNPGMIEQNIDYLTRDEMDYEDFLQQFAVIEEVVQIDPDEFDYMYYMYGLSMPGPKKLLIEPLEYRDAKRIREFVIAIDTSGSCAGDLVKKFITKTYSILKSTESFSSRVSIDMIQCDADIQEHKHITNLDEIEEYARNFKVKGFGGTDFRPVFEYIDGLIKKHEIFDLNGLIYFTDGYGTYPKQPPSYKTAFVFLDKYEERNVPPWAMRVYWKENEDEH